MTQAYRPRWVICSLRVYVRQAVAAEYHERQKAGTPKPENLWRYVPVAERSGAFAPGAVDQLKGHSELGLIWLEQLLLWSMLQHESSGWRWGRYVVGRRRVRQEPAGHGRLPRRTSGRTRARSRRLRASRGRS